MDTNSGSMCAQLFTCGILLFSPTHTKKVKLSTPRGMLLFPTPVGKSYTCDNEQVITMFSQVITMRGRINNCLLVGKHTHY